MHFSTLSPVSTCILATKSNWTRSTLSPKLNMFNSFDYVERGGGEGDGRLFVEHAFDKVERVEFDFVASVYWA